MSKSRNNKRSNKKQQQKRKQQNGGGYYNDLEAAPIGLRPVVASYDDNNPPAPQVGGKKKVKRNEVVENKVVGNEGKGNEGKEGNEGACSRPFLY